MNNEIIFYSTPDGDKKVEVVFQDENLWLTQKTLAGLFDVKMPAISKHLKNIFESGELVADSVVSILETVRQEGSRSVKRKLEYYNLDAIICVPAVSLNYYTSREETMTKATARHILVDTQEKCKGIKRQIEGGADFAEMAKERSQCPSGERNGGDLGSFSPGPMVAEFDNVVFSREMGTVHGPVQTQFGYHLIEITSRRD